MLFCGAAVASSEHNKVACSPYQFELWTRTWIYGQEGGAVDGEGRWVGFPH